MTEKTEPKQWAVCAWKRGDPTPNLNAALARMQGAMELMIKDKTGQVGGGIDKATGKERDGRKYKYGDLASAIEAAREPMAANGLSIYQSIETTDHGVGVVTELLHESGEEKVQRLSMPITALTAQALGSAMTYGRRYSYCAALGIAGEVDDDGKSANEPLMPRPAATHAHPDAATISKLIATFAGLTPPVSEAQLSMRLGRPVATADAFDVKNLREWFVALRDGTAKVAPPADPDEAARLEVQRKTEEDLALLDASKKQDEALKAETKPAKDPRFAAFETLVERIRAATTPQQVVLLHAEAPKQKLFTPGDLKALARTADDRRLILEDAIKQAKKPSLLPIVDVP